MVDVIASYVYYYIENKPCCIKREEMILCLVAFCQEKQGLEKSR